MTVNKSICSLQRKLLVNSTRTSDSSSYSYDSADDNIEEKANYGSPCESGSLYMHATSLNEEITLILEEGLDGTIPSVHTGTWRGSD